MKRLSIFLVSLALMLALALPASADYAPEVDYMERMMDAALRGDHAAGQAAQAARAEKMAGEGIDLPVVDFEELFLLSRLIWSEAGSDWLDLNWKMAVGEVALNRVASPEFPDTITEVVHQPGQYYGSGTYLEYQRPNYASVLAAARLLAGERVLDDPAVVFQSNGRQGSGVFLELKDPWLGSTYLCYSNHMELYQV